MESPQEHTPELPEYGRERLKAFFRRPALWIFLFLFFMLLYSWPFLPTSIHWTGFDRYIFLFIVWFFNVVVVAVIAASLPPFRQGGSSWD